MNTAAPRRTPRKVLGFSLDPALAAEVKHEAHERGISLRELFLEMWRVYKISRQLHRER